MNFFLTVGKLFQRKSTSLKNNNKIKEILQFSTHNWDDSAPPISNLSNNCNYNNFAKQGYIKNPIAFRAVNIIAHTTSSIKLCLMKCENFEHFNVSKNHALVNLINKPNPFISGVDFIEKIIYHLLIAGNAFILKINNLSHKPRELYILNPEQVEIITDKDNLHIIAYRYKENNGKFKDYFVDRVNGKSDVLHLKNFNPLNDLYGLSPFEAAAVNIDQHNNTGIWNKSLMENGARPSSAVFFKSSADCNALTQSQRNGFRTELDNLHKGPANSGKTILLEGGMEWKDLSIKPNELDFPASDRLNVKHIANALGVPVQMLNEMEGSSYNNFIESKRALYENTVLPLLNKIISNIFNNWLCPLFGKEYYVSYKEEEIPALNYKLEQLANRLKNSDFMTINEKRKIFGLSPVAEGDDL